MKRINIFGPIGESFFDEGITDRAIAAELEALDESVASIEVHLNSPGGDAFQGIAIANLLREQVAKGRTVDVVVDGLAASAASVVMMAGSRIRIADNAIVMIHSPWAVEVGDADDMRKMGEALDKIRDAIVATYRWHSELSAEAIANLMAAETWWSADEAIENGFAHEKFSQADDAEDAEPIAAARMRPKAYARLVQSAPETYRSRLAAFVQPAATVRPPAAPRPAEAAPALAVVRACTAAGCLDLVEVLLAENATLEHVNARVTEAKNQRTERAARAKAITNLCALAKVPQLAQGYINGGMSDLDVRAHLTTITALRDNVEIDTGLDPDHGNPRARRASRLDVAAIYKSRNAPRQEGRL